MAKKKPKQTANRPSPGAIRARNPPKPAARLKAKTIGNAQNPFGSTREAPTGQTYVYNQRTGSKKLTNQKKFKNLSKKQTTSRKV